MLYKIVAAAVLLTSADAFRIGEVAKRSIASGIAAATLTLSGPAFAELKQASDAEVYARADAGKLNSARVIERAKAGTLVDGSSATCPELEVLIRVDEKAIKFEKDKLEAIGGGDAAQKKVVADAEKAIEKQVAKLEGLKKTKGCAPELKQASDADVYKRADEGKLNAARAIERAKTGDLVDGSSATCDELDKLLETDREAIEFEKEKIDARFGSDKGKVQATEDKLQAQVDRLKKIRKDKGCASANANLKQATDFEVYKRADEGILNSARVIERAKAGKLVDGSGASCSELDKIISVDKKAVKFEKDKLEALGSKADPKDVKIVQEAEKAIEAQIKKLEAKKASKACA